MWTKSPFYSTSLRVGPLTELPPLVEQPLDTGKLIFCRCRFRALRPLRRAYGRANPGANGKKHGQDDPTPNAHPLVARSDSQATAYAEQAPQHGSHAQARLLTTVRLFALRAARDFHRPIPPRNVGAVPRRSFDHVTVHLDLQSRGVIIRVLPAEPARVVLHVAFDGIDVFLDAAADSL